MMVILIIMIFGPIANVHRDTSSVDYIKILFIYNKKFLIFLMFLIIIANPVKRRWYREPVWTVSRERLKCHIRQFLNFDDHITAICRSTYFHIRNNRKIRNLLSYNACSTIIHALIRCRLDYWNSLLYNVPMHKTDRLQRLQTQCARILTKSPRREREHITPVLKSLHWLKIQDRITYKILMLTYKSYYNIAPTYLCELISRRESSVNMRLGADHHQLIMPPISKDSSSNFLERSLIYAAPCEWNKLSECI